MGGGGKFGEILLFPAKFELEVVVGFDTTGMGGGAGTKPDLGFWGLFIFWIIKPEGGLEEPGGGLIGFRVVGFLSGLPEFGFTSEFKRGGEVVGEGTVVLGDDGADLADLLDLFITKKGKNKLESDTFVPTEVFTRSQ